MIQQLAAAAAAEVGTPGWQKVAAHPLAAFVIPVVVLTQVDRQKHPILWGLIGVGGTIRAGVGVIARRGEL